MKFLLISVSILSFTAILSACETTPEMEQAKADRAKRCSAEVVTGSNVPRCDRDMTRTGVISGEEVQRAGMPSSGPARGTETR